MKFYLFFTLVLFLGFLFIGCQNDKMPTDMESNGIVNGTNGEIQSFSKPWLPALEELAEKFTSAIANKDLDGFMSCWWNSPDVCLVLENGIVVRGWDNIRAGVEMMMEMHETLNVEVNEISRFRVGENVYAVGTATWTRTLKPEYGGGTTIFTERWTDVARKVHGNWVYLVDHAHDLTPFTQP